MYYLETNALISMSNITYEKYNFSNSFTSSYAIMEYLKNTNAKNYNIRRINLNMILNKLKYIEWHTPIENLSLMYNNIKIPENKKFKKSLEPLLNIFLNETKYCNFLKLLNNIYIMHIEEFDTIYKYIQNFIKQILSSNDLKETIKIIFTCPECFIANWHVEKLKNISEKDKEKSYQLILLSYNNKGNIFFSCCKKYFELFSEQIPNKNDLIDLLHTTYLINPTIKLISNDKKILKYTIYNNINKGILFENYLNKISI